MPCPILHQCQIRPTLKGQCNKARPHPMWRHRDPNSVRTLLHNTLHLVGMERFLLGMIAFAKTDKEWCIRRYVLTTSCRQVLINHLPNFNREFSKTACVAFAMLNDGHMIALFHHQIADGQAGFRATPPFLRI